MRIARPATRGWPDPERVDQPFADWPEPVPGPIALGPEPGDPPRVAFVPDPDLLVRVAADHEPAIAAEGADRVLGPYADDAARDVLVEAIATAAFLVGEDWDASPVDRELRDTRDRAVAEGLRAARRAPFAPWRVGVGPVIPLGSGRADRPIAWRPLPDPLGRGPARDGDLVFARIVAGAIVCGLRAPEVSDDEVRAAAGQLPSGRTAEEVLRRWGHALYRGLLERQWGRTIRTATR